MARKRSMGFWIGVLLIITVGVQYANIPLVSKLFSSISTLITLIAGIFLIVKQ